MAQGGGQLLYQFALMLIELAGCIDLNLHVEVSAAAAVQHRHALFAHAEGRAGLRAFWDINAGLALERGNLDGGAQRGLRKADGHSAVQVLAVALEEGVLADMQHDIYVAVLAAIQAIVALPVVQDARAVFHARRHLDVQRVVAHHHALAAALRAWRLDHGSRALAHRTGAGHAEEALLVTHLTLPSALLAGAGCLTAGGARAVAAFAEFAAAHGDVLLHAKGGVLKGDAQVLAQVVAAHGARASTAAPSAAKHVSKAEDVAEDVAEVHLLEAALRGAGATGGEGVVAVTVVGGALLGIAQDAVGLAALLEALLGGFVAGIAVGVVLQGKLAVGTLDLDIARGAADAEDFVIIAFGSSGQGVKRPPQRSTSVGGMRPSG